MPKAGKQLVAHSTVIQGFLFYNSKLKQMKVCPTSMFNGSELINASSMEISLHVALYMQGVDQVRDEN